MKAILTIVLIQSIIINAYGQSIIKKNSDTNTVSTFNAKYMFNAISTYDRDLETYTSTTKGEYPVVVKYDQKNSGKIVTIERGKKVIYNIDNIHYYPGKYVFLISSTNDNKGWHAGVLTMKSDEAISLEFANGFFIPGKKDVLGMYFEDYTVVWKISLY